MMHNLQRFGVQPFLSSHFSDAMAFAAQLHAGQFRKTSAVPYISHLLAVTAIALEHGANENEAIAALLHDAAEDQGGTPTLETIRQRFGPAVAEIVAGCTDSLEIDPAKKLPWRQRKENYIAHLADASPSVLLVSASEKLHNARSILADLRSCGPSCFDKFKGGRDGTLWYYRALVSAFQLRGRHTVLVEELARIVKEIENVAGANG
jgi:(p)ppGpp synthase/HD superfamily hydrolase